MTERRSVLDPTGIMTEPVTTGRPTTTERSELTLLEVVAVLLRHRWLIVGFSLALALFLGVNILLSARTFTSTASLIPQTTQNRLSALAGLAAQFGVANVGSDPGQSTDFYAKVLTSKQLLGDVVVSQLTASPGRRTLIEYYGMTEGDSLQRRASAVTQFSDDVSATPSLRAGTVELRVSLRDSELAYRAAQRMIELLNDFNLRTRQTRARAEREFTEGRLREASAELRASEERQQDFLQRNKGCCGSSPDLMFQHRRLERAVEMQQQVVTALAQAFEQARIDEVRDTPAITVVEPPAIAVDPDPRGLIRRTIVAMLAGLLLGVLVALWREYLERTRRDDSNAYLDFAEARERAATDIRHPISAVRRVLAPRGNGDELP